MKSTTRKESRSAPAPVPESKPLTIAMVAEAVGVSPATVSRILNGTAVVNDEKKKAVDDAVARLGYVPNPMARGLAGGRTLSIGVMTQAIDSPFYGAALRGIEDHWTRLATALCLSADIGLVLSPEDSLEDSPERYFMP